MGTGCGGCGKERTYINLIEYFDEQEKYLNQVIELHATETYYADNKNLTTSRRHLLHCFYSSHNTYFLPNS